MPLPLRVLEGKFRHILALTAYFTGSKTHSQGGREGEGKKKNCFVREMKEMRVEYPKQKSSKLWTPEKADAYPLHRSLFPGLLHSPLPPLIPFASFTTGLLVLSIPWFIFSLSSAPQQACSFHSLKANRVRRDHNQTKQMYSQERLSLA